MIPVTLGNSVAVGTNATPTISGSNNITLAGVTLNAGGNLSLNDSATVNLNGGLSGTGTLTASGGTVEVGGSNSGYTGTLNLNGSNLQINNDNTDPLGAGTLVLTNGTLSALQAVTTNPVANAFTLAGNTTIGGSNAINFNGAGNLNSGTLNINNTATTDIKR